MNYEELLGLHLSVAELHDQIWALAQSARMMSADMAVVVKWLDDAREHLRERNYDLAVQSLASAAKAIAGTGKATRANA